MIADSRRTLRELRDETVARASIGVAMALFGRRKQQESDESGAIDNIVVLTTMRLYNHGLEATVVPGTEGVDTVLVDQHGHQFPLRNLMAHLVPLSPMTDDFHDYLTEHVDSVVAALSAPSIEQLSAEEWLQQVRVRLLPESARVDIPAAYAQSVAPGLVAVLCIDSPHSVAFVTDADLEGRNVRALFDAGFLSVMAEPIDQNEDVGDGIRVIAGSSIFIATKMIGIRSLLGSVLPEAPHGVIVGVPHRHLIFAHPISGPSSMAAIGQLATMVAAEANDDAPSGPLSTAIYFWKDDVFETVGGPGEGGKIQIWPSERMMESLNLVT